MKQQKKDVLIVVLLLILVWSIILNWLQGNQVSRLMKEAEDMEQIQVALSSHIEELERVEGIEYGEE